MRVRLLNWSIVISMTVVIALVPRPVAAAKLKTENVIVVMSDGLRWQEVFRGAEDSLINAQFGGVHDTNAFRARFVRNSEGERREALLPFFWKEIASRGQIFGNTNRGSIAKLTNGKKFSYPGYNEVFSGFGDPRINSNNKVPNPNITVFEWLNEMPRYKGRTAVFGNWDVFAYIFNIERSKLTVWPVWENKFAGNKAEVQPLLDNLMHETTGMWSGATLDSFIYRGAEGYIKEHKPRLLFVGFGETDEWAHERRYDLYMSAAQHFDTSVKGLWGTLQSIPQYRNKTTLILTCDHGRGSQPADWKDHGGWVPGAEYIWLAVLGPDTQALGERTNCAPVGQNQIAATIGALLGQDFHQAFPKSGAPIADVLPTR